MYKHELDESPARRHLKSPRSLSGRSLHLTLLAKWFRSWSWIRMTYSRTPSVQCQSALPFWDTAISKFDHENPWSRPCMGSKVKVTLDLESHRSGSWPRSKLLVTFGAWSLIDIWCEICCHAICVTSLQPKNAPLWKFKHYFPLFVFGPLNLMLHWASKNISYLFFRKRFSM